MAKPSSFPRAITTPFGRISSSLTSSHEGAVRTAPPCIFHALAKQEPAFPIMINLAPFWIFGILIFPNPRAKRTSGSIPFNPVMDPTKPLTMVSKGDDPAKAFKTFARLGLLVQGVSTLHKADPFPSTMLPVTVCVR